MLTKEEIKKVLETELVGKEYNWKIHTDILKIVRLCFENTGVDTKITSNIYSRDNKQDVLICYKGYNLLRISILKKKGTKHIGYFGSWCDWTVKGFTISHCLIHLDSECSSDLVIGLKSIDKLELQNNQELEKELNKRIELIKEIQLAHPEFSLNTIRSLISGAARNWDKIEERLTK